MNSRALSQLGCLSLRVMYETVFLPLGDNWSSAVYQQPRTCPSLNDKHQHSRQFVQLIVWCSCVSVECWNNESQTVYSTECFQMPTERITCLVVSEGSQKVVTLLRLTIGSFRPTKIYWPLWFNTQWSIVYLPPTEPQPYPGPKPIAYRDPNSYNHVL